MKADLTAEIHMTLMHRDVVRSSVREAIHIEGNTMVDIREVIFIFPFVLPASFIRF